MFREQGQTHITDKHILLINFKFDDKDAAAHQNTGYTGSSTSRGIRLSNDWSQISYTLRIGNSKLAVLSYRERDITTYHTISMASMAI